MQRQNNANENKGASHEEGDVIRVQEGTLTIISPLGISDRGDVYLATYAGDDARINAMGNPIAVKIGKTVYNENGEEVNANSLANDIEIANHISSVLMQDDPTIAATSRQRINSGYELKMVTGGNSVLVTEYTPCGNLESFMKKAIKNRLPGFTAENNALAISCSEFASSIFNNMATMHARAKCYHFDIGARNVLIFESNARTNSKAPAYTTRMNDFGLSRTIPENGTIPYDTNMSLPILYLTTETYKNNQLCVINDLFAFRLTLLEMVGFTLDKIPRQVLMFDDLAPQLNARGKYVHPKPMSERIEEYQARRMNGTDSSFLATLVKQLMDKLANTPPAEMTGNQRQAMLFLSAFGPYIASMPAYTQEELESHDGIANVRQRDIDAFYTAKDKFEELLKVNAPTNIAATVARTTSSTSVTPQGINNMSESTVYLGLGDLGASVNPSRTSSSRRSNSTTPYKDASNVNAQDRTSTTSNSNRSGGVHSNTNTPRTTDNASTPRSDSTANITQNLKPGSSASTPRMTSNSSAANSTVDLPKTTVSRASSSSSRSNTSNDSYSTDTSVSLNRSNRSTDGSNSNRSVSSNNSDKEKSSASSYSSFTTPVAPPRGRTLPTPPIKSAVSSTSTSSTSSTSSESDLARQAKAKELPSPPTPFQEALSILKHLVPGKFLNRGLPGGSPFIAMPKGLSEINKILNKIQDIKKIDQNDAKKYWKEVKKIASDQLALNKPLDPAVKKLYEAMASENLKQLKELKQSFNPKITNVKDLLARRKKP